MALFSLPNSLSAHVNTTMPIIRDTTSLRKQRFILYPTTDRKADIFKNNNIYQNDEPNIF